MSLLNEASFLVTPNGYKEDKLYAAIPTNGNGDMTVTRTGTATRVNEAGLVELVPYNLLTRSEEFDNASWTKGSGVSVTANTTIAPDGTLTAYTLIGASSIDWSLSVLKRQPAPVSSSTTYTLSLYVKSLGSTTFQTSIRDNNAGGQVTVSHSINSDTWTRVEQTYTTTPTQTLVGIIFGGTDGDVAIWGAQIVKGSSALTYQKTVDRLDIPRIDYTGGGCPSILLEPLRTNIVLRSEEFNNASFEKNFSSVSANTTTAPDGTLTADTLTGDGTSGIHYLAQSVSATSGVAYTQSVFAKKGTNNFLQIIGTTTNSIYDASSWANFDLNTGFVGNVGSSATATITDFGNGWYRCTMTATATATASGNGFLLCLITSATSGRAETNSLTTSVYIWGAQVEAGAYPTSYIPTTTATVTRNADAISKTGISDLINSEEGVLFIEFKTLSETGTFRQFNLSKDNGNRIYITKRDSGNLEFRMTNPSGNLNFSFAENTTNDFVKVAFRYGLNDFAVFIDGVNKNVTSTGNVFASGTLNTLQFDSPLSQPFFGKVKQLALFPTPLSNDQCIALTTL
jgi:hypothetical protein